MEPDSDAHRQDRSRSGRDDRSKRRSRSSQHARVRSILRSLLLDSDKSEEEKGDAVTNSEHLSVLPVTSGPSLEVSSDAALLRHIGFEAEPYLVVSRSSNASFVAETPILSPIRDCDGVPATPTEEIDFTFPACGAVALPKLLCTLAHELRPEHQDRQEQQRDSFQDQHQCHQHDMINAAETAFFCAPPPTALTSALLGAGTTVGSDYTTGTAVDGTRGATTTPMRPLPGSFCHALAIPSAVTASLHARLSRRLPSSRPLFTTANDVSGCPGASAAAPAAMPMVPVAKGSAFASLILARSPITAAASVAADTLDWMQRNPAGRVTLKPVQAAGPRGGSPRSPTGVPEARASRQRGTLPLSPKRQRDTATSDAITAASSNSHYAGLALQLCKSPAEPAGAAAEAGDRPSSAWPGLSERLRICAGGVAGDLGQPASAATVTTVALPAFQYLPVARASAAAAAGAGTPAPMRQQSKVTAEDGESRAVGADCTPACQPLRGMCGAAIPSSAQSTPFDDDMLAALDSLERRVEIATTMETAARMAVSGVAGDIPLPNGAGSGSRPDYPDVDMGRDFLGAVEGHVAFTCAPLINALEIMRHELQQQQPPPELPLPPQQLWQPPKPHIALSRQPQEQHPLQQAAYGFLHPLGPSGLASGGVMVGPAGQAITQMPAQWIDTGATDVTPQAALRGVLHPAAAGAAALGSGAVVMVDVTPDLESGGVLAALDEAEERHRRAEAAVTVAAVPPADSNDGGDAAAPEAVGCGGAPAPQLAADSSTGGPLQSHGSPLPVKQLAFTPVQGLHLGHRVLKHGLPLHYQFRQQQQQAWPQQCQQTHAFGPPPAGVEHGLQTHAAAPPGLPPRAPVNYLRPLPPPILVQQQLQLYPEKQQMELLQEQQQDARWHGCMFPERPELPQQQHALPGQTGGHTADHHQQDEHELQHRQQGLQQQVQPQHPLQPPSERPREPHHGIEGQDDIARLVADGRAGADGQDSGSGGSSSSDDEGVDNAEAYAAPLTQRAVVEGHVRHSRRRSSLPVGREGADEGHRASGNLLASMMAAAGKSGGGDGVTRGGMASEAGDNSAVELLADVQELPVLEEPPPAPPQQLEAYLPAPLCQAYYSRGGHFEMYKWQAECLCQQGVLMGRNLVYCAPTSGGKSMVAELLGLRRLLTTGKPFMLVLPFVALCAEKADALAALLAPLNRVVNSAYGGQQNGRIIQPGVGAIVATIEKANMLVNAMLEEDSLGELSAVIVDELHMVGEEERGYLLELLLTKLRFATCASSGGGGEAEEPPFDWTAVGPAYQREGVQVIGMSATMPNVELVALWLDAALYTTAFRPVQLQEYVKVGRRILDSCGSLVREFAVEKAWEDRDADHVAHLTAETVREGHSVLIFCASKVLCEKVAEHIARMLQIAQREPPPVSAAGGRSANSGAGDGDGASPARNAREAYVAELRRLSGSDPALADLVARGVAYHHAGLSNEERDLVEVAYKAGAISVLTATSTLAAGVNLPARRVIFRHTYIGKQSNPIDATKYRQMSGRAGRAGIDTAGESYLICERNKPLAPLLALMQQRANPIQSCLTEDRKGMKRAVLEVVASGAVSSGGDVKRFIGCTLLHAQYGFQAVAQATIAALHWLKDNGFTRVDEGTLNWQPSPFGKATLASSMPPEDALVVRADLERARQSLVLATDLHITYLVTPIKEDLRVDWEIYFHWFEKLSRTEARVAELVGVVPAYLVKLRQGHRGARGSGGVVGADAEKERIARRFFAAMVLNDLIQEVPLKDVAEKYGLGKEKGPLEGLQERAGRFAAMVASFCERLGWSDLEVIIAKFQSRVWYGVRPEVVALTEIPYVKGARARLLFRAGLRTPEAVAGCELERLIEILSAGVPRNPEHEEQQRRLERRAARMIIQGAKDLVNQKVQELKEKAKALRAALNPTSTQQYTTPMDASLAPPQPPRQQQQQQQQQSEQQQQHPASDSVQAAANSPALELMVPAGQPPGGTAAGSSGHPSSDPETRVRDTIRLSREQQWEGGEQPGTVAGAVATAAVAFAAAPDHQRSNASRVHVAPSQFAGQVQLGHQEPSKSAVYQYSGEGPLGANVSAGSVAVASTAVATGVVQKRPGEPLELDQAQADKRARSLSDLPPVPGPPPQQVPLGTKQHPPPSTVPTCQVEVSTFSATHQHVEPKQQQQQQQQHCYAQRDQQQQSFKQQTVQNKQLQHQHNLQCPKQQQYNPYIQSDERLPPQHPQHLPHQEQIYAGQQWKHQQETHHQQQQQQLEQWQAQQQRQQQHSPQRLRQPADHSSVLHASMQPQHLHYYNANLKEQQTGQDWYRYHNHQPGPGEAREGLQHSGEANRHYQQQQKQQWPHRAAQDHHAMPPPSPQRQVPPREQLQRQQPWVTTGQPQYCTDTLKADAQSGGKHSPHKHVTAGGHWPPKQQQPRSPTLQHAMAETGGNDQRQGVLLAPRSPHAHHYDGQHYHQQEVQQHQREQRHQPWMTGGAAATATMGNIDHGVMPPPAAPVSLQGRFPSLQTPGFTVLKTAAEFSAVCEQLRQVGLWGFALDFADAMSAAPATSAPAMQLPNVPQVALGRGVLVNSIGLPLHLEMDEPQVLPTTTTADSCQLEGIALCAFDGCALYVPLMAVSAAVNGDDAVAAAERETTAVLNEVFLLLVHSGSTKVTFELKQQLLMARAAATSAGGALRAMRVSSTGKAALPRAGEASPAAAATADVPLEVSDPVVDARILLWMLNPDDPVNLPRGKSGKLSATKGLEERMKQPEVCGATAHAKAMGALNCAGAMVRQLPSRQADACRRAAMARRIYQDKLPRLQCEGLLRPLIEIEMPLVRVLAAMEASGVALAPQVLRDQRGPLEARLRQLAQKAHLAAGMTFDLNSPKDVSEVLFQYLGLPPPPCAFTSQQQKHPSTKKEVLEELEESTRHPILRLLLDYRSLHKLLTGFVETLYHTARQQWMQKQKMAACRNQEPVVPEVVRLSGTWLQTGTATGRLAMDEPNLQTIPRPVEYSFQLSQQSSTPPDASGMANGVGQGQLLVMEPGQDSGGGRGGNYTVTMHINLRNAFVAPPGHVLLTADYKQIELRLMAHFSRDPALCELLRNPTQDPFTLLAAEWRRVPVEKVTPEERVQAKRLAYGILYGMGTSTLAMELGVSLHEAAELSENFRRAIPGVDGWTKEVVEACRGCGYIVTLMGRRRYFPRINERSSKEARSQRAQSERQAVNSVCQGSAADLVKAAMISLTRRLAVEGFAARARLVLMVHDELVVEVESEVLSDVARLVQQVLEGEVKLRVPTPVKLSAGPSWGQLTEYKQPQLQQPLAVLLPPPPQRP